MTEILISMLRIQSFSRHKQDMIFCHEQAFVRLVLVFSFLTRRGFISHEPWGADTQAFVICLKTHLVLCSGRKLKTAAAAAAPKNLQEKQIQKQTNCT